MTAPPEPKRFSQWCAASHHHEMMQGSDGAWMRYADFDAHRAAWEAKLAASESVNGDIDQCAICGTNIPILWALLEDDHWVCAECNREALRAEIERLREENAELTDSHVSAVNDLNIAISAFGKVQKALWLYGWHKADCPLYGDHGGDATCTCGFHAALRGEKGK